MAGRYATDTQALLILNNTKLSVQMLNPEIRGAASVDHVRLC